MFLHSECVKDGAGAWPGTQLTQKVRITKVSSLKVQAGSPRSTFSSVFCKSTDVSTWCNRFLALMRCWKTELNFFMTPLYFQCQTQFAGQNLTWKSAASNCMRSLVKSFSLQVGRAGTSASPRFKYQRLPSGPGTWQYPCLLKRMQSIGSWLLVLHCPGTNLPLWWSCSCPAFPPPALPRQRRRENVFAPGKWIHGRQGDKSCEVIKPKAHCEVTLTDATVASQAVKDILPFSASGENQSWYLHHWRLQTN